MDEVQEERYHYVQLVGRSILEHAIGQLEDVTRVDTKVITLENVLCLDHKVQVLVLFNQCFNNQDLCIMQCLCRHRIRMCLIVNMEEDMDW